MKSPTSIAKGLIKALATRFGYEIKRGNPRGWNPGYLGALSRAEVVVDAGAGYGTPQLYEAFRDRRFILVEPLEEYYRALQEWHQKIDCKIIRKAVGAHEGEREIHVDPRRLTLSSMSERSRLTNSEVQGERRRVPVTTVDAIIEANCELGQCIALKIDVEGMELDVLSGSTKSLETTDLVIVETSVARCYENDSDIQSVFRFMESHGFRLFDIAHLAYYEELPGLMWADLLFVPSDREGRRPSQQL